MMSMQLYTTILGDTWDVISLKVYGSEYYINELMTANPKYMETVIFKSSIRLQIPEINKKASIKLPPWKIVETK